MLADLARFNRQARSLLDMAPDEGPSLREFLADGGYGDWFVERLIVPQAAAVWSADPDQMWSFPASFLARFFHNHGMLGLTGRPQWRTVTGGSRTYVEAISRPFADRVRLCAPVRSVTRHADHVEIAAEGCETERFDEVVIAAHSDQALAMLSDADRPGARAARRRGLSAQRGGAAHRRAAAATSPGGMGVLELPPPAGRDPLKPG